MFHELSDISRFHVYVVQHLVDPIISMMDMCCTWGSGVFFLVPQELGACYAVSRFFSAFVAMDQWIENCLLFLKLQPRCQHFQAAEKQKYESKVLLIRFNATFQGQRHQESVERLGT